MSTSMVQYFTMNIAIIFLRRSNEYFDRNKSAAGGSDNA